MTFTSFEEQEKFELWAFGKTGMLYDMSTLMAWNSRHGKVLFIQKTEKFNTSIDKMYSLYKKAHGIVDPDLKIREKDKDDH